MPAEWEEHAATWLTWPDNKITWPGRKLSEVESIYLQMMRALLPGEKVHLLVKSDTISKRIVSRLEKLKAKTSNLVFHKTRYVDTWIRDYGPIFLKHRSGSKAFTKWIFNAWGGKYSDLARDNGVVDRLAYLKKTPRFDIPVILEGGSIDVNGRGTLLTTEQCLLNPNRNPSLSRGRIEGILREHLGARKIIWLKEGIEGDDTDGHVDDITRFVSPSTIVTAVEPNRADKNHIYLEENLRILKSQTDADGRKFKIVELPMPGKITPGRSDTGHPCLPASYANFYIGNSAVLLPLYDHANDKKAVSILKKLFPSRKIAGIQCASLVYGLGSIHCVTQQEPA